jgi:nickel-dependent lactate racemase
MVKLVHLAYGEDGLDVSVPDDALVLEPASALPLPNPAGAVATALAAPLSAPPLHDVVTARSRVAIVVSDVTRPVPNELLLPPLLSIIAQAGVPAERVTIIIGTGMHRPSTPAERVRILGKEIADSYEVIDHDARDKTTLSYLTTTARGVEVWLNRRYMDADVRIVVGFVEPHMFAGYSGGGKGVVPGVAGADIVMSNHGADMIGHHGATFCVTRGNPIFEEQRDLALVSKPTLCLNVTLDQQRNVTGVFAGELAAAHDAAIGQAERQYVIDVPSEFDVVLATNMGYPADLNLYQSVKGMLVAARAVRQDGAILLTAECRDGLGLAEYTELLTSEASPRALLERITSPGFGQYDQWGVQCQAIAQARADVWLHSDMSRETTERAHLRYCEDVQATLADLCQAYERNGGEASLLVLPHGQLTVPRVAA